MYSNRKDNAFRQPFRTLRSGVRYSVRIAGIQVKGLRRIDELLINLQRKVNCSPASFRHNTDRDCTADSTLALLYFQVGKQDTEHILRTDSFGNVTERVDSCSTNRLLVCFEQFQKFEAYSHPFTSRHEFGTTIGLAWCVSCIHLGIISTHRYDQSS